MRKKYASTLIQRVRKLAEEHPNAVYRGPNAQCYYDDGVASDGTGWSGVGCIIGQAATGYLTIPEGSSAASVRTLLTKAGVESEPHEVKWLEIVQADQDSHEMWGKAVKAADETVYG